jgi:predicted hydrocarbon binding protein
MNPFQQLKDRLKLTEDNQLMLDRVPMILTPRWFFVGIMKRVVDTAGKDIASKIYYEAGYDGAYGWGMVQIKNGLSGREVMSQYLDSMTYRGWGRFEIVDFEEDNGKGRFRYYNSAVSLELGPGEDPVCFWVPGALAGCFQAILENAGSNLKARGLEINCLSQGQPFCEFLVEPVTK